MAASTISTTKPNFDKLPGACNLSPFWYERQTVRDAAFKSLAFLGCLSLGGAGYTGYTQSIKLPSFLLCLGTAVASFLVASRCLTRSLNDPKVALELRKKAGHDLENSPDLTFSTFFKKYSELLTKRILEPSDISPLLERDVEQLDYSTFVAKHAGTDLACKKGLFQALAPAYQERLRASCRVAFALEPKAKDEAEEGLLSNTAVNPNQEALLAKDWDSFIEKCSGRDVIPKVTEPQAREALKTLFLAKAYKRERDHQSCLFFFPEDVDKLLQDTLRCFELELLADGEVAFESMIWNAVTTWKDIQSVLDQIDPTKQEALKEKLRKGYLGRLSYKDLKSEEWKEMRTLLGLTDEMIENVQGSVRTDCDTLSYLGDDGFRRKYGNKPLKNNALQPQQLEKIKTELRAALPAAATISWELREDLKILGLHDEIFKARWEKMSLNTIWKDHNEISSFFENGESILGAESLKKKVINELDNLSIFLIVRDCAVLFPKFLKPEDQRLDGKTFAAYAEEQVTQAGSFSKDVVAYAGMGSPITIADYLPLLFKHGLLTPDSPALRKMLQNFLIKSGKEILEFSGAYDPEAVSLWKKLQAIPQIVTPALQSAYQMGRAAVIAAKAKLKTDKDAVNSARYEPSEASKRLAAKLKEEQSRLTETQRLERENQNQSWTFSNTLYEKNSALNQHQQKIYALRSTLHGLPLLQTRLQTQIADLEKQTAPDPAPLIQLTKDLPSIRSGLKTKEQEYKKLLEEDAESIKLQKEIEASRELLREAQKEASLTWGTLDQIERKIAVARNDISAGIKALNPQPTAWNPFPAQPLVQEKERTQKAMEECEAKLLELDKERSKAQQAHDPFRKKCEDLRSRVEGNERALAKYIEELPATKDRELARTILCEREKEQINMAEKLEVWNARSQVLEELRRKEQAIGSELEQCRADLAVLGQGLPALQAAYQTAKEQNDARNQKEKELKLTITQLEASVKQLQTDVNNDPDSKKFYAEREQKLKELDRQYQEELQKHIDALMKIVTPEDKAAS
jgi:hypothetical protein